MKQETTLEEVAERLFTKEKYPTEFKILRKSFISNSKWQAEKLLAFVNDEDNHTEGELGNSCIDVQTLVNFIEQFKKK